jgi:hypothetical protein
LLHSVPSSGQSCFAFSMISATVGSDTVGPKYAARGLDGALVDWVQPARQLHQRCSRRYVVTIRTNTDAACGSPYRVALRQPQNDVAVALAGGA